jgi:GH24 family phage-related lysozyme (muramidase)
MTTLVNKISQNGIDLIMSFEGLRLKAYKPISTEKYYTIGYGHYGSDVKKDMVIDKNKAIELLKKDCKKFENNVNKYQPRYNFNQNQYDALVSFAYNIGSIDGLTKNGTRSIEQIEKTIPLYNKAGGKVLKGLTTRRNKELALFKKGNTNNIYYPKYTGTSLSIIDALKSVGEKDTSYNHRKQIAKTNGVLEYKGSKQQNELLLNLLIIGKLLK